MNNGNSIAKREESMKEVKGIGSKRKLLIEKHRDLIKALETEGSNVFSAGVETYNGITYFAVVLKK